MMNAPIKVDVVIIGAGISGLICATELQQAGYLVQLIDKGRGFGGRMATRRMSGARLDHGAQYFTAQDGRFQKYVDQWVAAGVIRTWFRKPSSALHPRYAGLHGMTDVPKYLARSLDVHTEQEASRLYREKDSWIIETKNEERYCGHHLIITAPLPQAMNLLRSNGISLGYEVDRSLDRVDYEKGLAALAILDGPSGLPASGGIKLNNSALSWMADNQMKGISPSVPAITLHATASFAAKHWSTNDAERGRLMLEAADPFLKGSVVDLAFHRWRYTTPIDPLPETYFMDIELNLSLAGDAFGGPRIEGAALSGMDAALAFINYHRHRINKPRNSES